MTLTITKGESVIRTYTDPFDNRTLMRSMALHALKTNGAEYYTIQGADGTILEAAPISELKS